jgi:hypothetical protein
MLRPELARSEATTAVELKSFDGSASDRSDANDARAVWTPTKMVSPSVAARMKKTGTHTCLGVKSFSLCLLVVVAEVTGETEIIKVICAAATARNNMVNYE